MNKTILIILIVVILGIGSYFLLKGGYQAPSPVTPEATNLPTPTAPTEEIIPASEEATASTSSIKEFTISGTEYRFNPSSIIVSAGDRVKITFRNDGRHGHNFVIRDLDVSTKIIGSGQTETVEFTAPQSGTYTFICSVPGHAVAGMVGELIVK